MLQSLASLASKVGNWLARDDDSSDDKPVAPKDSPPPATIMQSYVERGRAPPYAEIANLTRYYSASRDRDMGDYERYRFVEDFGWSTPTEEAIRAIQGLSGHVLEIGAGNGLWAYLLAQKGVDIVATDDHSWKGVMKHFHDVQNMDAKEAFAAYGHGRDILMVWPPRSAWYAQAIAERMSQGQTLIYVGEGLGGQMADIGFFHVIERDFEVIEELPMPNWQGIKDKLLIFRHK